MDVADVPDVDRMLAAAARARAAGAEVVVASLHCCLEYDNDPTEAQVAAVRTLLASPDVDLVLGHHAHVVQPFEQVAGEWAAYGLGNSIAEHDDPRLSDRGLGAWPGSPSPAAPTAGSPSPARRPCRCRSCSAADEVTVRPADPETYDRVAGVLDRRGAVAAGLAIVPG